MAQPLPQSGDEMGASEMVAASTACEKLRRLRSSSDVVKLSKNVCGETSDDLKQSVEVVSECSEEEKRSFRCLSFIW